MAAVGSRPFAESEAGDSGMTWVSVAILGPARDLCRGCVGLVVLLGLFPVAVALGWD